LVVAVPGLDPGINPGDPDQERTCPPHRDGRDKPGHDAVGLWAHNRYRFRRAGYHHGVERPLMFKLIGFIVAAIPVILFLRTLFTGIMGKSIKRSQAFTDFKKQVDYVVWAILFMIGCGMVYSVGKLIYDMH
jgi:hypothetical protein